MKAPDVLVVGGGVIGCAAARLLAGSGRSVLLAERGAIGVEASSAAAGVLAVASGNAEDDVLAMRQASLASYPALVAALREETGIDVGYVDTGTLELCLTDEEVERQRGRVAHRQRQGFAAEWVDAAVLRSLEPQANPAALGAARFPDDACVRNERLVAALAESARRRGATILPGSAVRDAERRGDRIGRVQVAGTWVTPGQIVLAAGAWTSCLPGLPDAVDVRPARGQMLALRGPVGRHVLLHGDGCLVPTPSGEALVGSMVEDAGYVKAVTADGIATLLGHLGDVSPAARVWPVTRMWSGLRPQRDGGPFIDRHPRLENVVVAAGHHRNGILLAPITATMVQALVDSTRSAPPERTSG